MRRIVVVGASLAGHRAAHTLRERGYDGELTVVGAERHRPYDRYPLSKRFLSGELDRGGLDLAADVDADWRLGQPATGLDPARRVLTLGNNQRLPYDGLVVASGARAVDASAVERVDGAFVVRTVDDAAGLRSILDRGPSRVVVAGGGLIGAEVASTAVRAGHDTTLVDRSAVPTRRMLGGPVAEYLLGLHLRAGVRVLGRRRVVGLDVRDGALRGLLLDGGERLAADIVVMATGTRPNVEWLSGAGLSLTGGLLCGPTLHATGDTDIVAAGDVMQAPHPLLGEQPVRVEHWSSTLEQAALAAANLLVGPQAAQPWTAVPWFGTTIHGARIRGFGFPQAADRSAVVWGSVEAGTALLGLARGDLLVGVVALNAADRVDLLVPHLRPGARLDELTSGTGRLSTIPSP